MAEQTPEDDIRYLMGRISALQLLCVTIIGNLPEEEREIIRRHFLTDIEGLISPNPHTPFSHGVMDTNNELIRLQEHVSNRERS